MPFLFSPFTRGGVGQSDPPGVLRGRAQGQAEGVATLLRAMALAGVSTGSSEAAATLAAARALFGGADGASSALAQITRGVALQGAASGSGAGTGSISVVSGWDPTQLASLALWQDPGVIGTLSTDTAGATPVTADGDPVGRIADRHTSAHHRTGSGSVRPLYRPTGLTGGRPCLRYDGIDDRLNDPVVWAPPGAATIALEFALRTLPIGQYNCALTLDSGGGFIWILYMPIIAGWQSFSWRLNYNAGGASVGFGGASGAGHTAGARRRLVIGYTGGEPGTLGSYWAQIDGADVTLVGSSGFGVPAIYCGSQGAARTSGEPTPIDIGRLAVWGADHYANRVQISSWLDA